MKLMKSFILGLSLLAGMKAAANQNVGSRHVYSRLTPEQCSSYVLRSMQLNLDYVVDSAGLQEMLAVLSAECGLGPDPGAISRKAQYYAIEGTGLYFLNDGQKISFGPSAKAAVQDGVVPPSLEKRVIPQIVITSESKITKQAVGLFDGVRSHLQKIYNTGINEIYVSGYAYHDRSTYTSDKLEGLNEKAYGIGLGKGKINNNGNYEGIYAMAFKDSHNDMQYNVGYMWQKIFRITDNSSVGLGYTAALVSRKDIMNHFPIPAPLPVASLNVGRVSLMAVLIPKLNGGINHGNVVFLFGKIALDK